jgi:hypothetical protein
MIRIETAAVLSATLLVACTPGAKNVGALDGDTGSGDAGAGSSEDGAEGPGGTGPVDGGETDTGEGPMAVPPCGEDIDLDGVPLAEDNSPKSFNPDQGDQDEDGIADVEDLCPSVADASPFADSDHDGVGNPCDPCRLAAETYRIEGVADYMQVRNIPGAQDSDGDGIGDACDTCVMTPNCGAFGPENPWRPSDGDPIADETCQADADEDGIGDACEGAQAPDAAGPVGLEPDDDFDQDGLRNAEDGCPRSPVQPAIACEDDAACGPTRRCGSTGWCDHVDTDDDGIGDLCDTCPETENPTQNVDGLAQEDDEDGDFIGRACELGDEACATRSNPARLGFYAVSVEGWCCTTAWEDPPLLDPWGVPIDPACTEAQAAVGECVSPPSVSSQAPGQFVLPLGCEAALAAAGITADENVPLTAADVGGLDALWPFACRKPILDQDFDGIADSCDLCLHGFDPMNLPYIDENGKLWPDDGKYCNGDWAVQSCDED